MKLKFMPLLEFMPLLAGLVALALTVPLAAQACQEKTTQNSPGQERVEQSRSDIS